VVFFSVRESVHFQNEQTSWSAHVSPEKFQEYLLALQQKDNAAWQRLLNNFSEPMRQAMRSRIDAFGLRAELDTMDALHSAVRRLMEQGADTPHFTDEGELRRYLLTVSLNLIRDRARRRRQGPMPEIDPRAPGLSPCEQAMARELLELVRQRLGPIWVWKEEEGNGWHDILQRLGEPVGKLHAVETRYNRNLRSVLNHLAEGMS
jgi:hypothetical protein